MNIREYTETDKDALIKLWSETFDYGTPHNRPELSLENKLKKNEDRLLLIAEAGGVLCGSVMGGYDGHRGWIYSLAVEKSLRGNGIGTALVGEIIKRLNSLGCVKVNLQVTGGNAGVTAFYEKLGFAVEDRISMGKRLV